MMLLYKDGRPFTLNPDNINETFYGTKGIVYRINKDECLKVMNRKIPNNFFSEEIFNVFTSLDLTNFAHISVPFYDNSIIIAYIMEYLEQSVENILDMPIEYTLDNIAGIYSDLLKLAKHLITAFDLYHKNVILCSSKIVVIDFDSYVKLTSFEEALLNSLNNLMYTFRKLYEEALIKKNINFDEKTISGIPIKSYLDYLFNTRCFPNEPALVLKRKFVGAKTPMDLFKINR